MKLSMPKWSEERAEKSLSLIKDGSGEDLGDFMVRLTHAVECIHSMVEHADQPEQSVQFLVKAFKWDRRTVIMWWQKNGNALSEYTHLVREFDRQMKVISAEGRVKIEYL